MRELLYPSMVTWSPYDLRPFSAFQTRDALLSAFAVRSVRGHFQKGNGPRSRGRRIYLSRRHDPRNRFVNEEEIAALFAARHFEVVCPEKLSLQEQIALFGSADYVAGISGAAFANMVYAPEGCHFICFLPRQYRFYVYSTIAGILGQEFVFLDAENVADAGCYALSQFTVDADMCRRFLECRFGAERGSGD